MAYNRLWGSSTLYVYSKDDRYHVTGLAKFAIEDFWVGEGCDAVLGGYLGSGDLARMLNRAVRRLYASLV